MLLSFNNSEITFRRPDTEGDSLKLGGYAIQWNKESDPRPMFMGGKNIFIFKKGSLAESLSKDIGSIRFLSHHDKSKPVASFSGNKNRIWEDNKGLGFEIDVPEELSYAKELYSQVENGLLGGMSIGVNVEEKTLKEKLNKSDGDITLYTIITKAKLLELSAVTWPQFSQTNVKAMGKSDKEEIENYSYLIGKTRLARKQLALNSMEL